MPRSLPILVLLAACGWSEDKFLVKGLPDYCEAAADCVGFEVDACIDHVRSVDRSKCDYDPGAAKKCAKKLEREGVCQDNGDLDTFSYLGPEACDQIWDGCGPLFPIPIDEGTSPPPPTP